MAVLKVIDPVTRLEGHLKIEVEVETVGGVQQVIDAWASGTLFRGFELILQNRPPGDAPHITQRICGVCPVSHGMASVKALDAAYGVSIPDNARLLRNLVLGANFVQSHILHFYHLALLDFVTGPDRAPWQPAWSSEMRIAGAAAETLVAHYVEALGMRRRAHEMGALFGGRLPHPPTYLPGGFTTTPRSDRIAAFREHLSALQSFIEGPWLEDLEAVSNAYADHYDFGGGHGNLLAYGVFEQAAGSDRLLARGHVLAGGAVQSVDAALIEERVTHSWYAGPEGDGHPSDTDTVPTHPKDGAYSWLKSPRYDGVPYEVGPLARMWVNGDYDRGVSVLDRHWARQQETLKIAQAMGPWLDALDPTQPVHTAYSVPDQGSGQGLTEAPRGALGHWAQIAGGTLSHYQIITPTCWNASPRDDQSQRGALEEALVGTPVADIGEPVEVLRVVHSMDPCLACAVHVARPRRRDGVTVLSGPTLGARLRTTRA